MDLDAVFSFLAERQRAGLRCVLVTICSVEGSSMRAPGAHMGICEDGTFEGSLSGGCVEQAVVAEAIEVLADDRSRLIRLGKGSPYIDVRLPCGGGIDLHLQPLGDPEFVDCCLKAVRARKPFSVAIAGNSVHCLDDWMPARFDPADLTGEFGHWPDARLLIIGHGAGVEALAKLARSMECEVEVLTPDDLVLSSLTGSGIMVARLDRTSDTHLVESDPWTAIVFLFHDHDWEIELMKHALQQPHFYLGAMGGRMAHTMRLETLTEQGVGDEQIASISAPVGLFHSSRDPKILAISTFAEVMKAYQDATLANAFSR